MRRTPASGRATAKSGTRFRRPQRNEALRRSRRRRFIRRGSWTGFFLAVILAVLAFAGTEGWHWLRTTPMLEITKIALGDVSQAESRRLDRLLSAWRGRNLVAVDLSAIRAAMLTDPWVEDAMVRRVFPGTLTVRISEKRPVAVAVLDGRLTLVDRAGQSIVAWSARLGTLDLPLITGLDIQAPEERSGQIREGLAALASLRRHDPDLLARLSELDLSRADRITARLTDEPAPLYLSREEVTANLDHYLAVREDIHTRLAAVHAIDLRWRGRVVVVPDGNPETRKKRQNG
jgi:cell division protein FtsQ